MKAIITRPNLDGTYDDVGTKNRYLVSRYKTKRGLLRYGIAKHFTGKIRIELFNDIYCKPYKTFYIVKEIITPCLPAPNAHTEKERSPLCQIK